MTELVSHQILERFRKDHEKDINLTLRPAYRDLLDKLGSPQEKLPPVFHVAGTNGKGSTCAFLRAILEAAGYSVHVYTSPHLVTFHERIRRAGKLISENELVEILSECENLSQKGSLSYFEAATAAAFTAFARHPADFTILETGLGGRLDATNVVPQPVATLITRLSFDHREYLGDTIEKIAFEKAGIMRKNVPCFIAVQPDQEALTTLCLHASKVGAPLLVGGEDWKAMVKTNGFQFKDKKRTFDLPNPALLGQHQFQNAGLAIAALSVLPRALLENQLAEGLKTVEWPARLQRLEQGILGPFIGKKSELWLDGGHNDSAGSALALQARTWQAQDQLPLHLVLGMLKTKNPQEFLGPLLSFVTSVTTVSIPHEELSFSADHLADQVRAMGIQNVTSATTLKSALQNNSSSPRRILICGSLYLAGHVLAEDAMHN